MPKPYSIDLRWRVIWLNLVHHLSPKEISQLVCVSQKSVRRYIAKFELSGDVEPAAHRHGPQKLLGDFGRLALLRIILESPGIYLHEVQARLLSMYGVTVNCSTLCKTLKYNGLLQTGYSTHCPSKQQ